MSPLLALVADPFGFAILQSYSLLIAAILSIAFLVVFVAATVLDGVRPEHRQRGPTSSVTAE